jgi:hypothetical protein
LSLSKVHRMMNVCILVKFMQLSAHYQSFYSLYAEYSIS